MLLHLVPVLISFWEFHFTVYIHISLYIFKYAQIYNNPAIHTIFHLLFLPTRKMYTYICNFRSWKCFLRLSSYKNKMSYTFGSQNRKPKKEKIITNNKLEWPSQLDEFLYSCLAPLRLLRETEDICSIQFSHSVVSDSLRPHGLQCAWLPCPSRTCRACSNSC